VLHSFFGYSDAPTPLQLLIYVGYLAIVIVIYLGTCCTASLATATLPRRCNC